MSHKISRQEGREKLEWEQHCQELNASGLKVSGVPRWKKKQQKRKSKTERFMDMLRRRGGHVEQKQKKKVDKNVQTKSESA